MNFGCAEVSPLPFLMLDFFSPSTLADANRKVSQCCVKAGDCSAGGTQCFFTEHYWASPCNFQPEMHEDPSQIPKAVLCVAPPHRSASQVPTSVSPFCWYDCFPPWLPSFSCGWLYTARLKVRATVGFTSLVSFSEGSQFYIVWCQTTENHYFIYFVQFTSCLLSLILVPVNLPCSETLAYYYQWGPLRFSVPFPVYTTNKYD